ncbi:hypothetical protein J6590_020078 [Homalodisca vitripennis]|nr:hypothetical protein J6590_020078 [Homalodisca vitripennis]
MGRGCNSRVPQYVMPELFPPQGAAVLVDGDIPCHDLMHLMSHLTTGALITMTLTHIDSVTLPLYTGRANPTTC